MCDSGPRFNGQSLENETEFELIGIILGIAIYNGIILDVQFPMVRQGCSSPLFLGSDEVSVKVLYKKLMHQKPTLEDLEEFDPVVG